MDLYYLQYLLQLQHALVDLRVGSVVAFRILKHQVEVCIYLFHTLILVVLHLTPEER